MTFFIHIDKLLLKKKKSVLFKKKQRTCNKFILVVLRKYHYCLIFIQFTFFVLKNISWSTLSNGEQCPYPEKNLKYTVKLKIYGQYLFNFKNYACVLFWNDVHCKGYIIDYTLFNMCDVHVQVFRHTDISYSQCFDLFFASSVFVPYIKN